MSEWTHRICRVCYAKREPGRDPVRVLGDAVGTCCWCGIPTAEGIYCRADPDTAPCGGEHAAEAEEARIA